MEPSLASQVPRLVMSSRSDRLLDVDCGIVGTITPELGDFHFPNQNEQSFNHQVIPQKQELDRLDLTVDSAEC